jgi:hypothetical protein
VIAAEVLDALLEAGATAEMIVAAVKADAAKDAARTEEKRANDRERQRRHRASRDVTARHCDNTDTPSPLTPPLKVSPNPFKKTPPISPQPLSRGSRLPSNFETPSEWIEWAKAKRGWTGSEARDEAECFARYWQAKAGRDAAKLDWFKTWQNWVSNSRRVGIADEPVWDGVA